MESDGQRLYSVLTRTDVRDKMMKEIVQISEVFSLSQSDATVTLIRLGWDSLKASDLLGDDKEKFLSKLGLVQVSDTNHTDGDGDTLISTPLCSHKFCSDCWRDHLEKKKDDKTAMMTMISSLDRQDCVAASVTIEKLSEPVKEMYERYVLGSFMESNKIKWCPAKGCEYAIERHDHEDDDPSEDGEDGDDDDRRESSDDFGVVCLCGHTFCWSCKLESHRPVTCNNASLWLNELLDEAKRLSTITTKPCPRCNINVRRIGNFDRVIVTCVCSHAFCWSCLLPKEYHIGVTRCSEVYVPIPHDDAALLRHRALWEEDRKAMKTVKSHLEALERDSFPKLTESCGLGELDMKAVFEACMLIVQCRLVLKWSRVFGYFITDYHSAKKQYLDHLVEGATANLLKHKERVDELVGGAVLGEVVSGLRHKLETSTTATGNYFHGFVKTVEEGLRDVKAGVYENVPTEYWFCDRCTFQNDAYERKCRVCVFPFEGPSPPLLALGAASGHQQQQGLPNVSSNPFAYQQGGTNTVAFGGNNAASGHQQGVATMFSSYPFAAPPVAFGNSNSAHQQQVANMSNNPFASPVAFGNNYTGASVHQQQVSNMVNNPFASPGGSLAYYGNNMMTGASAHYHPNMANNNPFVREGPIFFAYGNNSAQVPNMANNPFARPGGTNPLQSPPAPFVAFGSASGAHQQQAAPNNPFDRQGGTNPPAVKEEPDLGKFDFESEI